MARAYVLNSPAINDTDIASLVGQLSRKLLPFGLMARERVYGHSNVSPVVYHTPGSVDYQGYQHKLRVERMADGWQGTWITICKDPKALFPKCQDSMEIILLKATRGEFAGYSRHGEMGNRDFLGRDPLPTNSTMFNSYRMENIR